VFRLLVFFTLLPILVIKPEKNCRAQSIDTLFLNSGQIVFGDLKGIALGKVTFKMKDLTTADINMDKVKTISANSHLFRIETVNKKVFYSRIFSSERTGYIKVIDSTGGGEIPLSYINTLTYYGAKKNIFEGNVSSGFNYTKSSNIGRFNLDVTMRYIMKRFTIQNKSSNILTLENDKWEHDRSSVLFTGTYYVNPTWKAIGLFNYQLNRELGLQYRFQQGAGAGYSIFANTSVRLWSLVGIVVNQEKSFDSEQVNWTSEIPVVLNFDLFRFSKPKISVSVDNSLFNSLTQKGRLRFDNEVRVGLELLKDFTFNLQFYSNYDNKPLSGTGSTLDYGIVFGIGFKWD
jgi:hypothetical protein